MRGVSVVRHSWIKWVAMSLTATSVLLSANAATGQETTSSVIASVIKKSLAHIIVRNGKGVASGTGFCIGSHGGTAYILTNKHVIASDIRPRIVLQSDPDSELYGRIDRLSTLDAAVIAVENASCVPLTLSTNVPTVGTPIGIAGFPAFQVAIARDASSAEASFHAGSVSALPATGAYIEYDAQTDRGNSGSPLFDAKTGVVVGLVSLVNTGTTGALQNNLAISIRTIASFISNSHANVAFVGSTMPQSNSASQPNPEPTIPRSGTPLANAIDSRCGTGVSSSLYALLSRASGELSANDYASTIGDERTVIQSAAQCAAKFYCPGLSCDDPKYVFMVGTQLMAQQNLRVATARTNGDTVNAIRNELFSTVALCLLPSIMDDGQPYSTVREVMKVSLKLSREIRAIGPYHGIVDAQPVRDCATKMGL